MVREGTGTGKRQMEIERERGGGEEDIVIPIQLKNHGAFFLLSPVPFVPNHTIFLHSRSRITSSVFLAQSAMNVAGAVGFAQGKSLVRPLLSVLTTTWTGSDGGALSKAAAMSVLVEGVPVTMERLSEEGRSDSGMDSGRRTRAVIV